MLAVEVAVGVDHLGLDPEAGPHAQLADGVEELGQAAGEAVGVGPPVAEAAPVVDAPAEPAVIHHEQLHAQVGGAAGELDLALLVDVEPGRLPRVVEDGPLLERRGEHVVAGVVVPGPLLAAPYPPQVRRPRTGGVSRLSPGARCQVGPS
ncbi:hypothetical protein GCM10020219_042480 [Nonomuraea dietziae]